MERDVGSCLCGDVRITASGKPYRVGLCHCLDCRKHHGALVHASAVVPAAAVAVDGETSHYEGGPFCARSGPSVYGKFCAKRADASSVARGHGFHLAFAAPSRASVHELHRQALLHGGRDNGGPGPRPDYGPHDDACFVVDPDGHRLEAVINRAA